MSEQHKPRLRVLTVVLLALAVVALGVPDRMLTHFAWAVERGRIKANTQELARVEEVSSAFRMVAKIARPGVVHISVEGTREDLAALRDWEDRMDEWQERYREFERDPAPSDETLEELQRERRRLQREERDLRERLHSATGSGVLFTEEGHILTNNHVAGGRSRIRVRLADNREYTAEAVGSDPKSDLAVVKIDAPDLHPLRFGDSDAMEVGDWVLAVGAPFGLSQTVTHGIISAKGRSDIVTGRRDFIYQDFLQTDAAVNPGNSGGPLLNLRGEVVGINTAIATNDSFNAGVAFTIPSNMAVRVANELVTNGEVARGWLGITMGDMTAEVRRILKVDGPHGVLVEAVVRDGPAHKAGLLYEDVILSVNGTRVDDLSTLRNRIADVSPGQVAVLDVIRDGEPLELEIPVGRRTAEVELAASRATNLVRERRLDPIGVYARTYLPNSEDALLFSADSRGVLVVGRIEDADGDTDAKLRTGEMIVAVNERSIASVGELLDQLRGGIDGEVRIRVADSGGDEREVRLRP